MRTGIANGQGPEALLLLRAPMAATGDANAGGMGRWAAWQGPLHPGWPLCNMPALHAPACRQLDMCITYASCPCCARFGSTHQ